MNTTIVENHDRLSLYFWSTKSFSSCNRGCLTDMAYSIWCNDSIYTPTCPSQCGSSWTGHSYPVHDVSRPRSKPMPAGGRNFRAWSDAGTRLFTRRKRAGLRVVILGWLGIDELVLHSNLTKSNLHMIDRSWSKINPGHPRPIIFYYIYIYLYCSASIKFKNRLPESPGMLEDLLLKSPQPSFDKVKIGILHHLAWSKYCRIHR